MNNQNIEQKPQDNTPSLFSLFTENIIKGLVDAAISGIFIYLIWNFTLSRELQLPELSYVFCACASLFFRIIFYNPSDTLIMVQLIETNRNLKQLIQLTSFGIAIFGMKENDKIMNIVSHPNENTEKNTENNS